MNLHHRIEPQPGAIRVVSPGDDGLRYLSFSLLRLTGGQSHSANSQDEELAIILLNGKCRARIGSQETQLGPRTSVFSGYASAAYVPRRTDCAVTALADTELAVCGAPSDADTEPAFIRPDEVGVRHVGAGNWSRTVTDIIGPNVPARRLIVGETYNPPGNWSSSPPHRHDNDNPPVESDMEEVYFYRFQPSQGFGLQRVYDVARGLDVVYTVKNDDVVSLPYGYHPVVAAPGYELYYLWALAGEKRNLIPFDDPEHAWVKRV
jgi:5-deoxy-glucuronate isomerase